MAYNDNEENREWYSLENQSDSAPASPAGGNGAVSGGFYKPARKNVTSKVVFIIAVVLLLFFAAAAIINLSDEGLLPGSAGNPSPNIPGSYDDYSGYDDFRDYFDDYFASLSPSGIYNIKRAEPDSGATLDLKSHAGLEELSLQKVYEKALPGVCGITAGVDADRSGYSWGTGIVFTENGYIVTNAHVIDGADYASVSFPDGREFDALLIGADGTTDIAVLKIDAQGLDVAEFSDLEGIAVGDGVVAIGNPLGVEFRGTMTNGIISAIDRNVSYEGRSMTLLQTNAAINEGNSGGPLINMYGQVIGITNMKMYSSYSTIEGIGFAIPITGVKPVVDALIKDSGVTGQPALGITVVEIADDVQSEFDIPGGLYVSEVSKASNAYKKGVRTGDIITHANGEATLTTDDLTRLKDGLAVGETITLTIYRNGKSFDVSVKLVERSSVYG
jgi:serine protease Do